MINSDNMDDKSTGKSNNSAVSYGVSMEHDPDTSSSIEDNLSNIIGRKAEGKVDRIDAIFLQPVSVKPNSKVKGKFQPIKSLIKLKKKIIVKKSAEDSNTNSKGSLLGEELSLRAENTNRIDHEYRKFIRQSLFVSNSPVHADENSKQEMLNSDDYFMDVEEAFDAALANYFRNHYNIIEDGNSVNGTTKGNKLFEVDVSPKTTKEKSKNFVDDFCCLSELINIQESSTTKYPVSAPPRSIQRPNISDKENLRKYYSPLSSPSASIK